MMQVPWILGTLGNNRATLVTGNGAAFYNNTYIRAENWGAVSNDFAGTAKLYLTKCHLEAVKHGYGAYTLGDTEFRSSGTIIDVADYGLIAEAHADASDVFTDGSVVNSRGVGALVHSWGGSLIRSKKGGVFNTERAVFQI